MDNPELLHLLQDLDYGHIYVIGNPKQTHNLRWFATMIEPMIRPLSLKWVETWDVDHTVITARRFNVGNMGRYATVQLHLNKYGRSDSYSLLAAVHAFSDCLSDVMDDGQGDVIINEREFSDRNETPHGTWGSSSASTPFSEILIDQGFSGLSCPQDHTRVERECYDYKENSEAMPEDSPNFELSSAVQRKKEQLLRERLSKKSSKAESKGPRNKDHTGFILREEDLSEYQIMIVPDDEGLYDEYADDSNDACEAITPEVQDLEVEEVQEFRRIESEYERDVNDLRARIVAFIVKYHQDPQQMMSTLLEGKVLIGQSPGHLLVNGDMKIVLPEYDEMEIKMPAMSRTLYILFMKLRKQGTGGIVLKNIDEHRNDIIDIYSMVKPGADEDRVAQSVDNLCDPFGDSLNQAISRINRCIKSVIIDKQLCKQYLISGTRGGEYSIALDPEWLQLPRAVTEA